MIRKVALSLLVAVFLMTNTGCFGSFSLTKKVYSFNESLGDKWIQSAVMWVMLIVPVYEVSGFIDLVFLNLLEFWTGNNPLAVNSDKVIEQTVEKNGDLYHVTIGKGTVAVKGLSGKNAGKTASLSFDKVTSTCILSNGTTSNTICTMQPKPLNTVDLHYPDGSVKTYQADSYVNVAVAR